MINQRFITQIQANLRYWQHATQSLSDVNLAIIDQERHNLFTAVQYGLQVSETGMDAAQLVAQLFGLVERRGYRHEWIPILQQATNCCPENEFELKAKLLNQLGFLYRLNHDMAASEQTHLHVINILGNGRETHEVGRAHFNLGNTYFELHQYEKAEIHANLALTIYQNLGLTQVAKKQAALLNLMGLISAAQGKFTKAENLYQQSILHWQKSTELTYLARTWSNLGLTFLEMSQFEKALHCFDQAANVSSQTATDSDKILIGLNRGLTYDKMQNWLQAEKIYREVQQLLYQNNNNAYYTALVANHLGRVLLNQSRYDEAETCLHDSIRIWTELNDNLMKASSLGYLAEVLAAKQKVHAANLHFAESIKLMKQYPNDVWAQQRLSQIMYQQNQM